MNSQPPPIRLLVVDDSAFNRRNLTEYFAGIPEVEVVGKAGDGEEALKLLSAVKPDVITLDLEMPRMDGFTFLRILMVRQPTPIIVVSSYAQRENVFKALELGALDFVTKPDRQGSSGDFLDIREEILAKVLMVRSLRPSYVPTALSRRPGASMAPESGVVASPKALEPAAAPYKLPRQLVAIASSTGGPSALLHIFSKVREKSGAGFVVAQHMPDKFTRTFAERLDRRGPVRASEAQDGDRVGPLTGFVCPGRKCMDVVLVGGEYRLRLGPPLSSDRYVPSGDRLFKSAAEAAGPRCIALVLTGMGDDGLEGARAVRDAGGLVVAEAQETAVVFGMPGAVVRAGLAQRVLPLPEIAELVASLP